MAQLIPADEPKKPRIGIAKGLLGIPDDFDSDEWNDEIASLFESEENK